MRLCKYCKTEQPEESFAVCSIVRGKVYRRLRCGHCFRKCARLRRAGLRQWLDQFKQTLCCERCGFQDYRALTFHHEGEGKKEFNIADMVRRGHSQGHIRAEIAKCMVLCANCHRIAHMESHTVGVRTC